MTTLTEAPPTRRTFTITRFSVFVAGVVVVPLVIGLANTAADLTEASAIRMAFASVAALTIIIITALALVGMTVIRRLGTASIIRTSVFAVAIIAYAGVHLALTATLLQDRLRLVAEAGLLG